ncbi:DUF1788 domain-containing protein [Neolewinella antarctica]|uniref:DUF1788 domain-containing protein n=1 Tax=Neolewinella antarctica TaxID=442734 RepID=A0ABX0XGP1_9BACT|nr:DUF1788 domain-containing protein [Neolewinella antarctica]NJC28495.1 hypothetical protein [Neolewinella antarctica]
MPKIDLAAKFRHAYEQIIQPRFLKMEAIGGEVPHYVLSYPPEREVELRQEISALTKKLRENGVRVLAVDVFALCHKMIADNVDPEDLYELEREEPTDAFLETMQSLTDMTERFLPALQNLMNEPANENYGVLFLHGVGQAYPFLRSHTLLENLQHVTKTAPTILFFPGTYTGTNFRLFGRLPADNFYRAFDMDTLKLS